MNIIGKIRGGASMRGRRSPGRRGSPTIIVLPRMLYARLLRSPVPHARIKAIERSRARAMAGVHLVLTGSDLPIPYGILPVSQDEHALAVDRVRFVGDPVALVVARDELTAGEALDLVDVEYERAAHLRRSDRQPDPRRASNS